MPLKSPLRAIYVFFFAIGLAGASWADCTGSAHTGSMRFLVMSDDTGSWIAAEGRIEADSADVFQSFLAELEITPSEVILNSIGGRLDGGLALGRAIRNAGLATRVGDSQGCGGSDARVGRGVCASACAYAFLGGVERQIGRDGHLGYHTIYPAAGQTGIDQDTLERATRAAMTRLQAYVAEMGANPILPEIAAFVAPDRLYQPQGAALSALGIETAAPQVAELQTGAAAQL